MSSDTTDSADTPSVHSNNEEPPALAPSGDVAQDRQCARCRGMFPIEPGIHPMELLGWWTCPHCTHALLPGQHRATTAALETGEHPS